MEIVLFGNSISIVNLAVMSFLYIFTISVALCGTITVHDIKKLLSFFFSTEPVNEEIEGFAISSKNCPCKNNKQCKKFSQNKCIDENPLHELNDVNAYQLEPGSYKEDKNMYSSLE